MINKVFDWDYLGWKEYAAKAPNSLYTQKDWNQTLVTTINRASATCYQTHLKGGANVLYVWSNLMNILETMEYYNHKKRELSGKFAIIPSYAMEPNTIIAFNSEIPDQQYKIVVTNYSTDRPTDVAPELPNDDQLGPVTSISDDLEYMFEKYLTTILYGSPNIRLATQIKDLIDLVQTGYKAQKKYDSKHVVDITDAELEEFINKVANSFKKPI